MNWENEIVWRSPQIIEGNEYSLRKASREEIDLLCHTINPEEMLEVWRLCHMGVEKILERAFDLQEKRTFPIFSLYQKNAYEENILAMGGLIPLSDNADNALSLIAEIWFLGTDMDRHKRFLAKHAKEILKEFLEIYPVLVNVVGAWNKRNIRWLRSLGFDVEQKPQKMGREKAFFHRFYITKTGLESSAK